MNGREALSIGWRNVLDHPLRSALTTLGVIIGVAAVVALVSLGASLEAEVVQSFAGDDSDVMHVSAGGGGGGTLPDLQQSGGSFVFTQHDVQELRGLENVQAAVPVSGIAASEVVHANDTVGRQWVTVTTPAYFDVEGLEFAEGRNFHSGQPEVVLNRLAAGMFETNVSVGDEIAITGAGTDRTMTVRVVGIVENDGDDGSSLLSRGPEPAIFAPTEPYYMRTVQSPSQNAPQRVYSQLLVKADLVSNVQTVKGRIMTYLGEESDARVLKSQAARFQVRTYEELVDRIRELGSTFTAYIAGIAVISLVVGAIGITNIMLVSVTERTREIGIMKAVGAANRDILAIFLLESVALGVAGAIGGIILGTGAAYAATVIIGLPFRIDLWLLGLAAVVGILVGVAAGVYPAWDAAQTDPIDALRYE